MASFFPGVIVILAVSLGIKAQMAAHTMKDGFSLEDLEPNKYFSYGVVPDTLNTEVTINFYDITISTSDCDSFNVEVQGDGYFKHEFHRLAILCDSDSLKKYTATSTKGFHVIIKTGKNPISGHLKAKFDAGGGVRVTNQVLYG